MSSDELDRIGKGLSRGVLRRELGFAAQVEGPVDAEGRVVPEQGVLVLRCVVVRALVDELGVLAGDVEAVGEAGRNPSSDDRLLRTPLEDDFDLDDLTPIIFFICLLKLLNDAMIDVEDAPLAFFDSSSAAARAIASESPKPDMPACTLTLPIRAFFASDLCTAP